MASKIASVRRSMLSDSSGQIRMALLGILSVLMLTFGFLVVLDAPAQATVTKTAGCTTCHTALNTAAVLNVAVNGSSGTTVNTVPGGTFELDWTFTNMVNGGYGVNPELAVPTGWTVAAGTSNSPTVTGGWNTAWDAADGVGWNKTISESTRYPNSPSGYAVDFSSTSWEFNKGSAADDATAADLDGTANKMGADALITVPAGTTPGSYTVVVLGIGHDATSKGYVAQTITVNVKPIVTSTSPNSMAQGATGNVTITGTGFTSTGLSSSFGSGITVNTTTYTNSTTVVANITVSGSATIGTRDVSVTCSGQTGTGTAIFSVTAAKQNQTITVGTPAPSSAAYNSQFTVSATASSGLAVSYSSGSTSICTNSGATFTMVSGTGTCIVQYDQAGDATYNPAPQMTNNVTATKISQATVTVSAPSSAYYGQTGLSASASGGSGTGTYSYNAGSSTACSVNSSTGALTITSGTGTCEITATRAGDSNYNVSAPSSPATVTITKANQATLSVTGPTSVTFGSTGNITTSGGSGTGTMSYDHGTSTGCTVNVGTGLITVTNASGTCNVTATKAADTNYNAATSDGYGVTLNKTAQATVTVSAPASAVYGQTGLSATASGGSGTGVYSYSAGSSTACTVNSSTGALTITSGTGTCAITATRASDNNYLDSAASSPATVNISKADQTTVVNVSAPISGYYGQAGLTATASGGDGTGAYVYSAGSSTACSVNSSTGAISITAGTGTCSITAIRGTDINYNDSPASSPAPVTVSKADQTTAVTVSALSSAYFGQTGLAATASGGNGTGAYSYSAGSSTACNVNATTGELAITAGSGTCDITAIRLADGNYNTSGSSAPATVAVTKADQAALTITSPMGVTYGSTASITVAGGSGTGTLSYSHGSSTGCTVNTSTGLISVTDASGSCTVTTTKAADANYNEATSAGFGVTLSKATQATVTVSAPAGATYGQTGLSASASGGSGTGAYSYSAGTSTACSVNASTGALTITSGTGNCEITATRATDNNYLISDVSSPAVVAISKANQSIVTVSVPSTGYYGQAGLTATASGGDGTGAYAYNAGSSSACSVNATSGAISIIAGTGTCDITASRLGDTNYNLSSTSAPAMVTVSKADQTTAVTVSAPSSAYYGQTGLSSTASGGDGTGVYSYSHGTSTACTVNSSTGELTITSGTGTCDITATKAGDGNYNVSSASSPATATISKADQTITFNALATKTYGDSDYAPGATASSSLTVSYASSNPAVATIVAGQIHIVGAGTTNITASQAGDANFIAASDVIQALYVDKANQTITFNTLPSKNVGDPDFAPGATSSSGLTVSYASSDTNVATVVSGLIHIVGAGTTTITASQSGDSNYNEAIDVPQGLTVSSGGGSATLTVAKSGAGDGTVNSDPSGFIVCGTDCDEIFTSADSLTLSATSDWKSVFAGWSGDCSGTGDCSLTMSASKSVTATFTVNGQAMISGMEIPEYGSLQDAYNAAAADDIIVAKVYTFTENLTLNRDIAVIFDLGKDDSYLIDTANHTTLQGVLTIEQGTLTVSKLIIE